MNEANYQEKKKRSQEERVYMCCAVSEKAMDAWRIFKKKDRTTWLVVWLVTVEVYALYIKGGKIELETERLPFGEARARLSAADSYNLACQISSYRPWRVACTQTLDRRKGPRTPTMPRIPSIVDQEDARFLILSAALF